MKAIICEGTGGPSVMSWSSTMRPQPKSGEVLIRVAAAGVNRPDVLQRMGLYQPSIDASPLLGLEVAGEIVAGDVLDSSFKLGDFVCALTHGGAYAEYVCVHVNHCLPIPRGWSMLEAASLPETFFTVWFNVFFKAALGAEKREVLLVHAGASGIGVAAIQMAKTLGQTVYATTRSLAKRQACLDLGADQVFDLNDESWVAQCSAAGGVDVVLDMLAGDTLSHNLKVLNPHGRLVWIAFLKGAQVKMNVPEMMAKEIRLTGSYLRRQSNTVKTLIAAQLREHIWPHLDRRCIRPVIDRVFDIEDVCAAHEYMERNVHIGKIVLRVA